MDSTILREARWIISNLAVLIVYLYLVQISYGLFQLLIGAQSSGGGNPFVEALGWATAGGVYTVLFSPVGAVYLVPYRLAVRFLGRPRLVAFALAAVVTALLWLANPNRDVGFLAGAAAVLAGYASVVLPPQTGFESLPPLIRGAIDGILLSLIWLVGSFGTVAWAIVKARRGDLVEAGVIAIGGTLGPALLLFLDLFRDFVPTTNYLVTGLLLAGTGLGIGFLAIARSRHGQADPSGAAPG